MICDQVDYYKEATDIDIIRIGELIGKITRKSNTGDQNCNFNKGNGNAVTTSKEVANVTPHTRPSRQA
ncbi:hypothetical protein Gotur_016494 [Gossypium turneri]